MKLGAGLSFEEAMRTEYRIVSRICRGRDFYEGVRATIIDKGVKPNWAPVPDETELDAYFAPLGADDELRFDEAPT
jgi:enoyl-CoA hydratase